MFQLRQWHHKLFLWLAALALLTFLGSLFPEVRRRLPWFRAEVEESRQLRDA